MNKSVGNFDHSPFMYYITAKSYAALYRLMQSVIMRQLNRKYISNLIRVYMLELWGI